MSERCGAPTQTGSACRRRVDESDERCALHGPDGLPDGHGAPEGNQHAAGNDGGAPEGNTNAMKHGGFADVERLADRLDTEGREHVADRAVGLVEQADAPELSKERIEELARRYVLLSMQQTMAMRDTLPGGRGLVVDGVDGVRRSNPALRGQREIGTELRRLSRRLGLSYS